MDSRNFLSLHYGSIGFFINKKQIYSSCYLEGELKAKSPIPFINMVVPFGDEKIVVFDLHQALGELFHVSTEATSDLLIVVKTEIFSPGIRKIISSMKGGNKVFSKSLLGLRTKSDARVEERKINGLKEVPKGLQKFLYHYGILACSLHSEESLYYFIDIDKICGIFISQAVTGKNEKGKENR